MRVTDVNELIEGLRAERTLDRRSSVYEVHHVTRGDTVTMFGHTTEDAVKAILVGADAVMMASALLLEGQARLRDVRSGLASWLDEHDLTLREARGMLSQMACADTRAYERAQYVQAIGAANAS